MIEQNELIGALALAATKLEAMAALPDAEELMPVEEIRAEATLLRSRLKAERLAPAVGEAALAETWARLR